MATHPDYYSILGVQKAATSEEIRKAYKKLARKYHPDANADDASALEKFKQIQTAWAVLGDEKKRSNFDKYGSPDEPRFYSEGPQGGGPADWSPEGGDVPFDLEELFGSFGARRASGSQRTRGGDWAVRGHDIRTEIRIPFQMAAEGGTYELRFQRENGVAPETLAIAIPAGIDTGSVVRLAGQGGPGSNGGMAGDLLVSLDIAPHPWFKREGANVLLEIPTSVSESGLGTKVDIPTVLDGIVTLTIPPGTSSGSKLRLRGKGIRDRRTGERGDMLAIVKIVAPKNIDERTRELLEELQSISPSDCRAGIWGQS